MAIPASRVRRGAGVESILMRATRQRAPLAAIPRAPALTDYVKQSILEYIRQNALQPGTAIPSEKELSLRLGVGRNSVREAVQALVSLGVLETRQGSGIFVRAFSLDPLLDGLQYHLLGSLREVSEFLEVRLVLELAMIGEVLQRITDGEIAALEPIVEEMHRTAERGQGCIETDGDFHRLLFGPAGNGILVQLLDMFWLVFRKASEALEDGSVRYSIYEDHAAILAAVKARDLAAARAAIRRHYALAQGRVQARGAPAVRSQPAPDEDYCEESAETDRERIETP